MKKMLTILLFIVCALPLVAQVNVGIGYGHDFGQGKILANSFASVTIHNIVLEGEMRPTISRAVGATEYFGVKVGFALQPDDGAKGAFVLLQLPTVTPSIGYFYDIVSKQWRASYSIKFYKALNDNGGLFLDNMIIHKAYQLSVGFNFDL